MIDHACYIENVVKDELAKASVKLGIDKIEVGYAIGGMGGLGLLPIGPGQVSPSPLWSVMLSVRSKLIGQPPVADSVGVPGILPPDEAFRSAVSGLLDRLVKIRDNQFNAGPAGQNGMTGMDLSKLKFNGKPE